MSDNFNPTRWAKLEAFELDDTSSELCFSDRLARDNHWPKPYAKRVVEEYKRFLYLCCEAGHTVTPSEEVDQAWHLHLCYTRSYWQALCRDTLDRPIHHDPTRGGKAEGEKFSEHYRQTLASYRDHFGQDPPQDIWPTVEKRFAKQDFRRVDVMRYLLLPRRAFAAGLAGRCSWACWRVAQQCSPTMATTSASGSLPRLPQPFFSFGY